MNILPDLKANKCSLCNNLRMVWYFRLTNSKVIALCKYCIVELFGTLIEKYNEEKMLKLINKTHKTHKRQQKA